MFYKSDQLEGGYILRKGVEGRTNGRTAKLEYGECQLAENPAAELVLQQLQISPSVLRLSATH